MAWRIKKNYDGSYSGYTEKEYRENKQQTTLAILLIVVFILTSIFALARNIINFDVISDFGSSQYFSNITGFHSGDRCVIFTSSTHPRYGFEKDLPMLIYSRPIEINSTTSRSYHGEGDLIREQLLENHSDKIMAALETPVMVKYRGKKSDTYEQNRGEYSKPYEKDIDWAAISASVDGKDIHGYIHNFGNAAFFGDKFGYEINEEIKRHSWKSDHQRIYKLNLEKLSGDRYELRMNNECVPFFFEL